MFTTFFKCKGNWLQNKTDRFLKRYQLKFNKSLHFIHKMCIMTVVLSKSRMPLSNTGKGWGGRNWGLLIVGRLH